LLRARWRSKRTKGKAFFELAFTEDWRAILGEVFLASLVDGYTKIFIIRSTGRQEYWKSIERFLRLAFSKCGIFQNYQAFRPRFILFEPSLEKEEQMDKIEEIILHALKDEKWIK
jgi:hypothetical protein